jgi:hypothetical protein
MRCTLYKHRETGAYFTLCSDGNSDPPLPYADAASWWPVDKCENCKVPGAQRPTEPAKPAEAPKPPPVAGPPKANNITGSTTIRLPLGPFHPVNDPKIVWHGGIAGCRNATRLAWNDLHLTIKGLKPKGMIPGAEIRPINDGKMGPAAGTYTHTTSDDSGTATIDVTGIDIGVDAEFAIKFFCPDNLNPVPADLEIVVQPTLDGVFVS